jgi:peptidoglycan/xylan/chitin deacetylase (PgdA/CDA1 family)
VNPRPWKTQLLRWLPSGLVTTRGPRDGRSLYLTIDDGPHPSHTPAMLEVLAEHGARATFFLVGREAERHPDTVRRIVAAGHVLGNHSYSHPRFGSIPLREQLEEIEHADRVIAAFDGRATRRFRPPRGELTLGLLAHFAARRRAISFWSYDTLDYQRRPPEELVEVARRTPPRSGDIVLMHDDGDIAPRMLRTLLPEWRAAGFEFRALPE